MVDRKEVKDEELLINLSPAYYQWEVEILNRGKQVAVVKLVKAGMNLEQIALFLERDPAQIQQALSQES